MYQSGESIHLSSILVEEEFEAVRRPMAYDDVAPVRDFRVRVSRSDDEKIATTLTDFARVLEEFGSSLTEVARVDPDGTVRIVMAFTKRPGLFVRDDVFWQRYFRQRAENLADYTPRCIAHVLVWYHVDRSSGDSLLQRNELDTRSATLL